MALAGTLDKHRRLKLIIGHMGEMLPVMMTRIDEVCALDIEHLQRPVDEVAGDPVAVIDRLWKPIAHGQMERRKRGERATHRLSMLPGISRRSRLLLGPLQGLLVDA